MATNLRKQNNIVLGSSCPEDISDEIMVLAQRLSKIHGQVRLASESGGVHMYIASPICLSMFGPEELLPSKMHLAVNADKYLGRPPYDKENDFAAMCMKTGEIYKVSDLLEHSNLNDRGFLDAQHQVVVVEKNNYLEPDGKGNEIPRSPGSVVSLAELSPDHPAITYLHSRDFDPLDLVRQFEAEFCTDVHPESYHKEIAAGFKASPPHRILKECDVVGRHVY